MIRKDLYIIIILSLLELILVPTTLIENSIYAQDKIFRVAVGLFGIKNTEDKNNQIVIFATTNNITKARILNTTELDMADGQDGMIERITFSFPNVTVKIGDEFEACVVLFENLEDVCRGGYNSPINAIEYVGLSLEDAEADQ